MNLRNFLLLLVLLMVFSGCSSSDDTPAAPATPDTPSEFTARGWRYFESEHFSAALADFDQALVLLPSHGEAMAGKGWSNLKLSVNISGLNAAAADFESARTLGENHSYVLAGLASARLAQGGSNMIQAATLAVSVAVDDPSFVFSHQTTINTTDMILISALYRAAVGEFSMALYQADLIEDSGIDPDYPGTWVVAGTTHNTYNAAVLARLHQLSEQYSG